MKTKSDFLSASRIKVFHDCPMKFYLQYVAEEQTLMPDSWGSQNGTMLHEVFEEYANGTRKDWEQNLIEKFRAFINDNSKLTSIYKVTKGQKISTAEYVAGEKRTCGKCPFAKILADGTSVFCKAKGEDINSFSGCPRHLVEDTLKLAKVIFEDDFNPIKDMKILAVEHEFDITFNNGIRAYGFMDLVSEVDENTIEIRDYKSAKKTPSDADISSGNMAKDIQMQLYFAIAKYCCDNDIPPFSSKYKNILVTIHFLRKCPVTILFSDKDYKNIVDKLKKEQENIVNMEKPLPLGLRGPNKFWICDYCNKDACQKACIALHKKTREDFANE